MCPHTSECCARAALSVEQPNDVFSECFDEVQFVVCQACGVRDLGSDLTRFNQCYEMYEVYEVQVCFDEVQFVV